MTHILAEIALSLAQIDPCVEERNNYRGLIDRCALCGKTDYPVGGVVLHDAKCPWLLARRWQRDLSPDDRTLHAGGEEESDV